MKRNKNFLLRKIADINIIIPLGAQVKSTNGIITLNGTGVYIWELLRNEHSLEEIAASVSQNFDVSFSRSISDVGKFINEINCLGLLEE